MAEKGPLKDVARQFMYFETGQGSEFTYGKHNGIDMTTTEALCYGLARRYDPFMVNNVTGFIGRKRTLDNFEMIVGQSAGPFHGQAAGTADGHGSLLHAAFQHHARRPANGHANCSRRPAPTTYMDVCLNTDRMLAYFDTSGHDDQTLREVHGLRPAPEFLEWGVKRGIFAADMEGNVLRGPRWGDPKQFCESETEYQDLMAGTPALYGLESAGPRPANAVARQARLNQGVGREAIHAELRIDDLQRIAPFRVITTEASSKEAHLGSPDLGKEFLRKVANGRRRTSQRSDCGVRWVECRGGPSQHE